MKIKRTVRIDNDMYKVGDIISFELAGGEEVEAMAVKQDGDNMIFCFVDCLNDEYPMNSRNTKRGGYKASMMPQILAEKILPRFPEEIVNAIVPFANGDMLRLPTEKEIFGENKHGEPEPAEITQWEPMKFCRNRIAFHGLNGAWEWYWLQNPLRDVTSGARFCLVNGGGSCDAIGAANYGGVRPVFQIRNL